MICLGYFNGYIGTKVDGFEGVHGGFGIVKRNLEGRLLLEFCVEKDLCVGNSWFKKKDSRKVTFNRGCSGTEIDFVLMKRRQKKFLMDVRVIGSELQHKLLKVVLDRRWFKNARSSRAKKEYRTNMWKLLNEDIKTKFSEKMEVLYEKCDEQNAWLKYKSSVLKGAEVVRVKIGLTTVKLGSGARMCKKPSQKRRNVFRGRSSSHRMKINLAIYLKKRKPRAVAEAMKKEAVKEMEEIRNDKNFVFRRMRMMKKEANDLAGNNCIKNENGKIVFAENGRKRVWKAIMNEENPWDGMVNVEVIEGPMEPFAMNGVERALRIMKNGKAIGPNGIVKDHLAAYPHGMQVILQIENEIFDEKDMPHEWRTSKGKVALWTVRAIEV